MTAIHRIKYFKKKTLVLKIGLSFYWVNFDLTNLTIITQSEIKNDKLILLCDSPGDIDVKTLASHIRI